MSETRGWSSGFKNSAYYEADRDLTQLTHADFANDAEFEGIDYSEDMTDYLLSKDYDKFFTVKRNNQVTVDTTIANTIFYECWNKYRTSIDSVLVFHILTDFYNIDGRHFFEKLVKKSRMLLIRDLQRRVDMPDTHSRKINATTIQKSFLTHIKNTDI